MNNISGGSQYTKNGKTHYHRNKQAYLDKNKELRRRNQAYIDDIKKQSKCIDCNLSDKEHPEIFDFDHKPDTKKKMMVSQAVRHSWSIKKIDEEIAKCNIRCANCHRIITKKRSKGL